MGDRTRNRSGGPVLDPDINFPPMSHYVPKSQLPTNGCVISMVRFLLNGGAGGCGVWSLQMCLREVAKQVYAKYYHDTVYCFSVSTIERRLKELMETFNGGRKRLSEKVPGRRYFVTFKTI